MLNYEKYESRLQVFMLGGYINSDGKNMEARESPTYKDSIEKVEKYIFAIADMMLDQYVKDKHIAPDSIRAEDRADFRESLLIKFYTCSKLGLSRAVVAAHSSEDIGKNLDAWLNDAGFKIPVSLEQKNGELILFEKDAILAAKKTVENGGIANPLITIIAEKIIPQAQFAEAKKAFEEKVAQSQALLQKRQQDIEDGTVITGLEIRDLAGKVIGFFKSASKRIGEKTLSIRFDGRFVLALGDNKGHEQVPLVIDKDSANHYSVRELGDDTLHALSPDAAKALLEAEKRVFIMSNLSVEDARKFKQVYDVLLKHDETTMNNEIINLANRIGHSPSTPTQNNR